MQNLTTTIGIDVSKGQLDVCIFPDKRLKKFRNDTKGISALIRLAKSTNPSLLVFEPSGGYEKQMQQRLLADNLPCAKINARQIRDFARCIGKTAKTDAIDAGVLAEYAATIKPGIMAEKYQDEALAELVKRKRQLVDDLVREKNRLDKNPNAVICRSIKRHIKLLENEILSFDKEIEACVSSSEELSRKSKVLTSVNGIGKYTAAVLIAEMPELGQIGAKPIASLAGLAPHNYDSGNMRGKRMISGGRISVRCSLYMATLAAIRQDGFLKDFYQHLKKQGKPSKVAIVAAMRKLLIRLNAKIRDEFYA